MKNKRELSIKNLCIISKVAKRKEVARERLVKTAEDTFSGGIIDGVLEGSTKVTDFAEITTLFGSGSKLNAAIYAAKEMLNYKPNFIGYKDFIKGIQSHDFESAANAFKEVTGINLSDWVTTKDGVNKQKYSETVSSVGAIDSFNFGPALEFYLLKLKEYNKRILESWNQSDQSTNKKSPPPTRRAPATDPTARMRTLLIKALYDPGNGKGWDSELNNAFLGAYNEWRSFKTLELKANLPEITEGWKTVATQIGFEPNISGAEALVTELISLKKSQGDQASGSESAATAAAPGETPVDNTTGAKTKLTELFNMILSGSTKVDRVGIDLRRDTMIFKGVITGIGGPEKAVEYVFSEVQFRPEQLDELTKMNFNSNQKIAINALSPVRNLFVDIRKESTRGIRNNAFNAASLSRAVKRWLAVQPATAAAQATPAATTSSIRKSIEIRKAAARKKLGL